MDEIEIRIDRDSVRIWIDQVYKSPNTGYFGDYDVRGGVEIRCGHYHAHGALDFSTEDVWQFYTELRKAYKDLTGKATFRSSEGNLVFTVTFGPTFGSRGHFVIEGAYHERQLEGTRLVFEMSGDQSYLQNTFSQLSHVVSKYGDHRAPQADRNQEASSQRSKWPPYR